MSSVGRNDPCPCGSGRKYKQCCIDKAAAPGRGAGGGPAVDRVETWKLFALISGVWIVVGVVLWLAGLPRAGQAIAGAGILLTILWAAFRAPPPVREDAGNAAALDFGQRRNKS